METSRMIDLNADVGESFGAFRIGADEHLFPLISSANVACGFHGGDPRTIERTVNALTHHSVEVGAHPSFPDLVGFGRRVVAASADDIRTDVLYQIGALQAFCTLAGVPLHHVKPHGALYNLAANDRAVAEAIVAAVQSLVPDAFLYAQAGSELASAASAAGIRVMREAFADRAYMSNGMLAPRDLEGAVLTDPELVAGRVLDMISCNAISTLDGDHIVVEADTICIHSDTPTAVPIAGVLRRALAGAGITVQAPK